MMPHTAEATFSLKAPPLSRVTVHPPRHPLTLDDVVSLVRAFYAGFRAGEIATDIWQVLFRRRSCQSLQNYPAGAAGSP